MSSHTLDRIISSNRTSTNSSPSKKKEPCKETSWYTIAIAVVALIILACFCYYFFYYKAESAATEESILDEMKTLAAKNRGVPRTYVEGTSSLEDFREYSRTHEKCEVSY